MVTHIEKIMKQLKSKPEALRIFNEMYMEIKIKNIEAQIEILRAKILELEELQQSQSLTHLYHKKRLNKRKVVQIIETWDNTTVETFINRVKNLKVKSRYTPIFDTLRGILKVSDILI